jgi:hypothetical protein
VHDGTHTYYAVEHRRVAESPWLAPEKPRKPVRDQPWNLSSWDYFGWCIEPWHTPKGGGHSRPKYPKSHKEAGEVRGRVGHHGWWTLAFAKKALARLRAADKVGKFDYTDPGTRKKCQAVRYQFRLIKVVASQTTTPLAL